MHDDATIISQCLSGETGRYRLLVDRYAAAVRAFLIRKLNSNGGGNLGAIAAAEEAAQETFVRAYHGLANLREPDKFASWLLGIAANIAHEIHREPKAVAGEIKPRSAPAGEVDKHESEHPRAEELTRAIESLDSPYREAIMLRYWAGLSCQQVADQQAVSLGTITKRLSRAHALLRAALEAAGDAGTQAKERTHELRRVP